VTALYRSAPYFSSYAPAKAFPTAQEALRHARTAADACRVAYAVYECIDGRPRRLGTFPPPDGPAVNLLHPGHEGRTR
jgi:hypothetical protein